jgi:hypothetical protein
MNRSWEGVSEDVMSFVILGVESGAIKQSVSEAHNILDMALETNGFERLKQRYATVKVAFEKAKKKGEQPKTTMDLKPVVQEASRSGRPFDKPRKVVWLTPTGGTFNNDACVVVWNGQFQQVPKNPWYQ